MRIVVCTMALLAFTAIDARAQMSMGSFKGYLTGHVGAIAGGPLTNERLTAGASVSVQEQLGWGAEIDFGHTGDALVGRQILDINSYMVNAAFIRPVGPLRPFAIAGAGIVQVDGCDYPCNRAARTYDLGLNAGAGAFLSLQNVVGLRADVRYFFAGGDHPDLNRPENMHFWRFSVGVTYMWDILP